MMNNNKIFSRIMNKIDRILDLWAVSVMALMSILVILSVFFRYALNITYTWSEELIIILFIMTTYFGAIICMNEGEHIDIGFLRERVPSHLRHVMDTIVHVINIIVQLGLAYLSFEWIEKTGSSVTVGMKIPYTYIYIMFPISFISMALYEVRHMIKDIKAGRNATEEEE